MTKVDYTFERRMKLNYDEGKDDGRALEHKEMLLEKTSKKLSKGKSISQIADELEESEDVIEQHLLDNDKPSNEVKIESTDANLFDDISNIDQNDDVISENSNLFTEEEPFINIVNDTSDEKQTSIDKVDTSTLDQNDGQGNEVINSNNDISNEKSEELGSTDLFEEIVPFEVTPLFDDKYDDDIFGDKTKTSSRLIDIVNAKSDEDLEKTMPDIFWNVSDSDKKKLNEVDDNVLSFDEQVEKLMGNTKTLKKVS